MEYIVGQRVIFALMAAAAVTGPLRAQTLTVDGAERTYELFVPEHVSGPAPAIFVLHGGGREDGSSIRHFSEVDALARREGIIAVYPNGTDDQWNDGRVGEDGQPLRNGDDVRFLLDLIERLATDQIIDPARVFVVGISNGGVMAQRLACEVPHHFAGVAVIAANKPVPFDCAQHSPLPMIFFHGTDDRWMPYDGGRIVPFLKKDRGVVVSASETVEFWADANGCDSSVTRALADEAPDDGTRVEVVKFASCQAPVVQVRIIDGGHTWPGVDQGRLITKLLGPSTRDIDGNAFLWDFFESSTLIRQAQSD